MIDRKDQIKADITDAHPGEVSSTSVDPQMQDCTKNDEEGHELVLTSVVVAPATEDEHDYLVFRWLDEESITEDRFCHAFSAATATSLGVAWSRFRNWVYRDHLELIKGEWEVVPSGPFSGSIDSGGFHEAMGRRFNVIRWPGVPHYEGLCLTF